MILFWILWVIDAIVELISIYFFFIGLADGSVASSNMALWLIILLALAAILGGSVYLKSSGRITPANLLLSVVAIPALLFGLYFLVAIFGGGPWN